MSKLLFLCDENLSPAFVSALRALEPAIDVLRVGEVGAPPLGTLDPDLLIAVEVSGRCLITLDRQSMPAHLAAHFAAGRHTNGVILLRVGFALARYLQDILLVWSITEADEWLDRTDYQPY